MFDLHYDLLTVAYVCYLKNDFSYLEDWCHAYRQDNIKGVVANLYFMSLEEMRRELHPDYYKKDISVVEMFRISTEIVKKYLPCTELLFSIEGCDYLEVEDLEELYSLGLRNILPVWNNKNKYASGNRSDDGLTSEGKKLIDKAIELGISIDLSHANRQSFDDIISYIKEKKTQGFHPFVMASHSNARNICGVPRNLTDEQILALKEVDGLIGVVSYQMFVVTLKERKNAFIDFQREKYLMHIRHIVSLIGIDSVCVSTDNMYFLADSNPYYVSSSIYLYDTVKNNLLQDLRKYYPLTTCEKILYSNFKARYDILVNKL